MQRRRKEGQEEWKEPAGAVRGKNKKAVMLTRRGGEERRGDNTE